jgi:hypothetical protein
MIILDILYNLIMFAYLIAFGIILIEGYIGYKIIKKNANKSNNLEDYDIENVKIDIEPDKEKNDDIYYLNELFLKSDVYKYENMDEKSVFINMFYKINTNKYDIYIENISDYDLVLILKYFNTNENFLRIINDFIESQKFKNKMD